MKDLKVALIAAVGLNNEIGIDNKLPWRSPSDLKNFKDITQNGIIIMGRKTFESLPNLLQNRKIIVMPYKSRFSTIHYNITKFIKKNSVGEREGK